MTEMRNRPMEGQVLELSGVGHEFPGSEGSDAGSTRVLEGIDLSVASADVVGIVGESGCGKTTLGRIAAGLLRPTSGDVRIRGTDPFQVKQEDWVGLRRDVRMIFQSPAAALNPFLKIRELCEEPLRVHEPRLSPSERRRKIDELAEQLDFRRLDQYPRSLSGGEKRRASLVRALAVPCRLLVADEPTSGLDVALETQTLELIEHFRRAWEASMVLISHHLGLIERLSNEVLVLYRGHIVERGRIQGRVFPGRHPYSLALWKAARLEFGNGRPDPGRRELGEPSPSAAESGGCVYRHQCTLRMTLATSEQNRCEAERPKLLPAEGHSVGDASSTGHLVSCHFHARQE
jgi:ABC-type glutathione transport system ATPase component